MAQGIFLTNADHASWQEELNAARTPIAVASLPSAATAGAGARRFVTDATSSTFNAAVTGGGSNKVPVFSDGAAWKIG